MEKVVFDACDDPKVVSGDVEYEYDEEDWFGLSYTRQVGEG